MRLCKGNLTDENEKNKKTVKKLVPFHGKDALVVPLVLQVYKRKLCCANTTCLFACHIVQNTIFVAVLSTLYSRVFKRGRAMSQRLSH